MNGKLYHDLPARGYDDEAAGMPDDRTGCRACCVLCCVCVCVVRQRWQSPKYTTTRVSRWYGAPCWFVLVEVVLVAQSPKVEFNEARRSAYGETRVAVCGWELCCGAARELCALCVAGGTTLEGHCAHRSLCSMHKMCIHMLSENSVFRIVCAWIVRLFCGASAAVVIPSVCKSRARRYVASPRCHKLNLKTIV